jgi:hypothetical protein
LAAQRRPTGAWRSGWHDHGGSNDVEEAARPDPLDAFAPRRSGRHSALDPIVAQSMAEFDGLAGSLGTLAVAGTRPVASDPALTRPRRFDTVIRMEMTDPAARRAVLAVHLLGLVLRPGQLAAARGGCSGAVATHAEDAVRGAAARVVGKCEVAVGGTGPDGLEAAFRRHGSERTARAAGLIEPQRETAK